MGVSSEQTLQQGKNKSCKLTVADSHNKLTENTDAPFSGN